MTSLEWWSIFKYGESSPNGLICSHFQVSDIFSIRPDEVCLPLRICGIASKNNDSKNPKSALKAPYHQRLTFDFLGKPQPGCVPRFVPTDEKKPFLSARLATLCVHCRGYVKNVLELLLITDGLLWFMNIYDNCLRKMVPNRLLILYYVYYGP